MPNSIALTSPKAWYLSFVLVLIFQFCFSPLLPNSAQFAQTLPTSSSSGLQASSANSSEALPNSGTTSEPGNPVATINNHHFEDVSGSTADLAEPTELNLSAKTPEPPDAGNLTSTPGFATNQVPLTSTQKQKELRADYAQLPLRFELNQGQEQPQVKFVAKGGGYNFFLTEDELVLELRKAKDKGKQHCSDGSIIPLRGQVCTTGGGRGKVGKTDQGMVLRMSLVGANPKPTIEGQQELSTKSHYLRGKNPKKWQTDLTNYEAVLYRQVYPGIDLRYSGEQGQLEYTFVLSPGADPNAITLKFRGHDKIEVDSKGQLVLTTGTDKLAHRTPVIYQENSNGTRQFVQGSYTSKGNDQLGFAISGSYDPTRPLIIDPVLVYSTYIGGAGDDYGQGIAVDSQGQAYVTGYTWGDDFPTTAGAFQRTHGGNTDIFVAKLNADGNELLYSSYVGGTLWDDNEQSGNSIAVDSQGNAYVVGSSGSNDFPTTPGVYQTAHQNGQDVVVFKLNSSGSALIYSTFVGGGEGEDYGKGIALDNSGNVYVVGATTSTDFPTTSGAYHTTHQGGWDGFAFKLNSSATSLIYSTFLGGSGDDNPQAVVLDSQGYIYVAGYTTGSYPTTSGAYGTAYGGGGHDGFVSKIMTNGTGLVYSTYLGRSGDDYIYAIALDSAGNAYVTGSTTGSDGVGGASFPTTSGVLRTTYGGGDSDGFVSKIVTNGTSLVYSTFLGGGAADSGQGIKVDSNGYAYITGYTYSSNFVTTTGALQTGYSGVGADVFVTKLKPTANGVGFSTYMGGTCFEYGWGLTLDQSNNVYVTGYADSTDFPTTPGSFQPGYSGAQDAFVAKFSMYYLSFSTSPTGGIAGVAFPVQPVVTVKNWDGTTASDFNSPISLTIKFGSGTSGATLAGTTTVNAVNGVATFSGLSIDKVGNAYQLHAASNLLDPTDSLAFNINGGSASSVKVWGGSNQTTLINTLFPQQLQALVTDGGGNPVSGVTVTFNAPSGSNQASGAFSGATNSVSAVTNINGLATASALTANGVSGNFTVVASVVNVASTASFTLTNTVLAAGRVTLRLDPIVAGPNPLSTTQILTATLTDRTGLPLANQNITFVITDTTASPNSQITSTTKTTTASGQISFTYSSTVTGTHLVRATTTYGGTLFQSNDATVYWVRPLKPVSTSPVNGLFFPGSYYDCSFSKTLTSTAAFSQTFPAINFGTDQRPFTDYPYDVNGNALPSITAQGNGYQAGLGTLENFQAVFSGTLVVSGTGSVTFSFYSDDGFILGIGKNLNGSTTPVSDNTLLVNAPSNTAFLNYPVMGAFNADTAPLGRSFSVTFNEPGIYPYELDYIECRSQSIALSMQVSGSPGTGIPPAASITLVPTTIATSLTAGQSSQTFTATVTDGSGAVVTNQPVVFNLNGANTQQISATTNLSGQAIISYTAKNAGTDQLQALTWIKGEPSFSTQVAVSWNAPANGGGGGGGLACNNPSYIPGWLTSPVNQSLISQPVSVVVATTGVGIPTSLTNGKVQYWPLANPGAVVTLTANLSGAPSNPVATFDPTVVANGSYVIQMLDTASDGSCKVSTTLVKVTGEYKPGRVRFTVSDLTVPLAGFPVSIDRTYDSLERSIVGDFGNGWTLSYGSPRLEVSPDHDVTLTFPDGKRSRFAFVPQPGLWVLGFLQQPGYQAEPGLYGSLSSDGCGLVVNYGTDYMCFPGGSYGGSITTYTYTDPYGRVFKIDAATGKYKSIQDLSGNVIEFKSDGIRADNPRTPFTGGKCKASDSSYVVCYAHDSQGRITTITDTLNLVYSYSYSADPDPNKDLIKVTFPQNMPGSANPISVTYTYDTNFPHLFKSGTDAYGVSVATTNYYADGRLKDVTDAAGFTTGYTYTLGFSSGVTRSTTLTNPDGGKVIQEFDTYGKVATETVTYGVSGATGQRLTHNDYDASHNVTATTLPDPVSGLPSASRVISYQYDGNGHRTKVTNSLGYSNTTTYGPFGNPTQLTNEEGIAWGVGYNDDYLPTEVSDALGKVGGYSFNPKGSILTRTDGNKRDTQFEYDAYGNKTKETDPLGNFSSYGYDTMGRVLTVTDQVGNVTKNEYDALGRLITTTQGYGTSQAARTIYRYDANGNKINHIDANNNLVTYTYNAASRLVKTSYADGSSLTYAYDWRGNVISTTDQLGHTTLSRYDLAGQLISTTTGLNNLGQATGDTATMLYEYDAEGRKVREYNPYSGAGTRPANLPYVKYEYDGADRLITLTNQLTYATVYSYDKTGRKISEKDANGRTTYFSYDIRGRLITTTYPTLGYYLTAGGTPQQGQLTTILGYDGAGNVLTRTNQAGLKTLYTYDEAGRLTSVSIPITHSQSNYQKTSYDYYKTGQLRTIIDANNHSTGFEYDPLNRQSKKIWPDGSYEQFNYDGVGNQLSHRLADGQYNNYNYDALNRLRQISYFDGQSVVYTYTATGKRQAVQDNRGVTSYSYDGRDRVTLVTQPASSNSLTVTYGYDAASNRTSMGTKVGTNLYIYTDTYRLWKVYDPANGVAIYNYDPVGLRTQLTLPNGVNVAYSYDSLNRLINITQTNSTSTLATYAYQLGAAGNRLKVDEAGGSSYQWAYDDAYRLISETYKVSAGATPTVTQYGYDPVGNRLSLKVNSASPTSYSYNLLDRLTNAGATNYYYDNRGNLIRQGDGSSATNYQFDAADRLTKVTLPGGTTVANYKYDADGRRVQQQIVTSTTATTSYLWDELSTYGDVVLETDGNGAVQTSYVLANCGCSTGAELISQKKGAATHYFLMDGQGSVRNLTDSSGNLVSGQSYRYDAFGNLQSGQTAPASNYLYTGQQFDVLSGLYDLRARYYNPGDGRFLSRDTYRIRLKEPIELNRYNYVNGNPVNYVDPSGHFGLDYATTIKFIDLPNLTRLKVFVVAVVALGLVGALLWLRNLAYNDATTPPPPSGGRGPGSGNKPPPEGFGSLAGREFTVSESEIQTIQEHLAQFGPAPENEAMLVRLRTALSNNQKISDADASFYFHELKEAELMKSGLPYEEAHQQALSHYGVSPFSVYHPEVIRAFPENFNENWFRFWGIKP